MSIALIKKINSLGIAVTLLTVSASFANVNWTHVQEEFDVFVHGTQVVASTVLPVVGEIVTATGHPEIGTVISAVGEITATSTKVITDVEQHNVTSATQDALNVAGDVANAAHDHHAERVITNINNIVTNAAQKAVHN